MEGILARVFDALVDRADDDDASDVLRDLLADHPDGHPTARASLYALADQGIDAGYLRARIRGAIALVAHGTRPVA